jgi:mannose-6-phosphate isomerase-like protein (cupin superfamily)
MNKLFRFVPRAAVVIVAVVATANLLHRVVLPAPAPDPATFPRTGDRYGSTAEGVNQEVVAVRDGWLVLRSEISPGAPGPPVHVHRTFAEKFRVESGTLHLELPDGVVQLGPGEEYRVEAGVAHRPFNPTDELVVVASDEPVMPQSFGACLVQVYPLLDAAGGRMGPKLALRIAALDPMCELGPPDLPTFVRVGVDWLVLPFARLFGYKNYYPERSLHPPVPEST